MKNSVLLVDYYYRCILLKEPPLSAEKIPIPATSKSNGDVITDQPAVVTDTVSNISYTCILNTHMPLACMYSCEKLIENKST